MEQVKITIVGAGVIGLAVAAELSKSYKDIFVIEKNPSFGQEISSRNSEVIHAGIYYPQGSLKAKCCVEGKELLYEFCREKKIGHHKMGKFIVALNENEIKDLENLSEHAQANGVRDMVMLSPREIKKYEPHIRAQAALYSPSTGIFDTHAFMQQLVNEFKSRGGEIVFNTELTGIDTASSGFTVQVKDKGDEPFQFHSRILINCAGLFSDRVSAMIGLDKEEYRLKYCKGDYFRVHNNKGAFIGRLIYPVPKKDRAGLGIHATLDLTGSLRLGPDDTYIKTIDYAVDEAKAKLFYESVKSFLPFIDYSDLACDMAGIRPKLQGHGEPVRDFIIREESGQGFTGFINLIGIESPGLTSALSIARLVGKMVHSQL